MECRIAVMGAGTMGRTVAELAEKKENITFLGMVEPLRGETLTDLGIADVIVDFSHPDNLPEICNYARDKGCAVVIATTGHEREELAMIDRLSESVPVVMSANFSIGISVVKNIVAQISPLLKDDFDIEIIEKHHRRKLDAPSGTALALAAAIDRDKACEWVYGRKGQSRRGNEIGIHGIRGGTIVGEHTVLFAGEDEIIEIRHSAASRRIFAVGALKAALFAASMPPGFYSVEDALK